MMTKRQSREMALQVLFQKEFLKTTSLDELFDLYQNYLSLENQDVVQSKDLIITVATNLSALDALIEKYANNWSVSRLSLVDLNILRMGIAEMMFLKVPTPPVVAIDEAIELAKKYSSLDAPGFINGILDKVYTTEVKREA
ncbi:MAG: transcription antitermination factor NusB [Bdellovibrionaceae bacterium]|nr:transcription antitermination factor NusB [Pseudobdellovibrionaceae bacterium]